MLFFHGVAAVAVNFIRVLVPSAARVGFLKRGVIHEIIGSAGVVARQWVFNAKKDEKDPDGQGFQDFSPGRGVFGVDKREKSVRHENKIYRQQSDHVPRKKQRDFNLIDAKKSESGQICGNADPPKQRPPADEMNRAQDRQREKDGDQAGPGGSAHENPYTVKTI